ncbi:antitoxin [Actinomycetospora sp. NBRC 106375]|uniref:type II toxin-antitoxin system Phd/YefM family antitoxin n=1 Tax=Actinomycetospora sp. NBRC 106375 TaxID=3032207 RepID=UPI0024A040AE|nr:type II toxin-antitoxin system prevent-host-death family antitoxin [Actinomycetospora sp. NBRC 106375]GLZ48579.1 antitoxin [Actinomycetospora sp. NBRC 106375]
MADQVNVYEAKTQLSKLLERVEAGEEIVIARNGRPVARLVPSQRSGQQEPRRLGGLEGKIFYSGDINDGDDEIEALFYAEPIEPPGLSE